MKRLNLFVLLAHAAACSLFAADLETKPADPYFEKFQPAKAPPASGLVLKQGDRLAICGDSITEQKMYSRIMETYLTVCVPDLDVTVRQYGWGGETASGFLKRMTNDCLRFKPTIATTCYGMNDHGYRPYEEAIGAKYREKSTAIVQSFKAAGARVIQGSPGCVGTKNQPGWDAAGVEAKNLNLCTLRNLGLEIAQQEKVGFADVFWPMLTAGFQARNKYDPSYAMAGRDGVHPGWAGHLVMAYAFLKSFGLDGEIGTFTVDLKANQAAVSKGHKLVSFKDGELQIESSRYPFCASGSVSNDSSLRSAMTLVPFNQELNRLRLVVKNGAAKNYRVTWGMESKTYSAEQLAQGVNLADEFTTNPFTAIFNRVESAVAAKQNYETKQIKQFFHDLAGGKFSSKEDRCKPAETVKDAELLKLFACCKDGQFDADAIAAETEKTRAPLAAAIKTAFVPVTHTLRITTE
ncbi:MAG: SGNH/GDSL hydrolase family protein [Verrucomicrobia bacterium]|nr:SGNH/GDSL hydrolase family protein [Verrucomicrobiota bacterium]